MNQQKPLDDESHKEGSTLLVHSIFSTLQGEGPFAGHSAIFIRLAGCNLQCPACDTEYTGPGVTEMTRVAIVQRIVRQRQQDMICWPIVVITGGEPFRQNITPLISSLVAHGFRVQVETNGTMKPVISHDFESMARLGMLTIVCSPKTGRVNLLLRDYISAYKYVLDYDNVCPEDGLPIKALDHPAYPKIARPHKRDIPVFVQPADRGIKATNELNMEEAARQCMRHGYTFQLQMHKIIGLP